MREITSKNNQIFKNFQKLEAKKYRDRFGLYLIEGENLIEEAYKGEKLVGFDMPLVQNAVEHHREIKMEFLHFILKNTVSHHRM